MKAYGVVFSIILPLVMLVGCDSTTLGGGFVATKQYQDKVCEVTTHKNKLTDAQVDTVCRAAIKANLPGKKGTQNAIFDPTTGSVIDMDGKAVIQQ